MEKRILIVDDEPRVAESLGFLFQHRGFFVETAFSGADALQCAKKRNVKAIISDLVMDGMDGLELLQAIKAFDSRIQVIMLTGYASFETASLALGQEKAFAYLQKPVKDFDSLVKLTEKAMLNYDRLSSEAETTRGIHQELRCFKDIFDTMEAMIYVADMGTHELLYANRPFITRFNSRDDTPIGKKCWDVIHGKNDGPCRFCTNSRIVDTTGQPGEPFAWEFYSNRTHQWFSVVDQAIVWHDRRIVRLEVAFDITRQKLDEKRYQGLQKQIETTRLLGLISTFAGGVAHDFNNSLASILGHINLAQTVFPSNNTLEHLTVAEKRIFETKELALKFVSLAKERTPERIHCRIKHLLTKLVEEVFTGKDVRCNLEIVSVQDTIDADPMQLKTAIRAVLDNALESVSGNGEIGITLRESIDRENRHTVVIRITDTGCGIAPDHLDQVFHPYFSTKSPGAVKGKGLGLTAAWAIVHRHGGTIDIRPRKSIGTEVSIRLPVSGPCCPVRREDLTTGGFRSRS